MAESSEDRQDQNSVRERRFRVFMDKMPPTVRKRFERSTTGSSTSERSIAFTRLLEKTGIKLPPPSDLPDFPAARAGYYLVEVADGEIPKVTLRGSAEDVLNRIRALDGQDVYVYTFYGVHIPVTVPPRAMLLPDKTVLSGPERPEDMPIVVEVDGYLASATLRMDAIQDFEAMEPSTSTIPKEDEDISILDDDLPGDDDLGGLDDDLDAVP